MLVIPNATLHDQASNEALRLVYVHCCSFQIKPLGGALRVPWRGLLFCEPVHLHFCHGRPIPSAAGPSRDTHRSRGSTKSLHSHLSKSYSELQICVRPHRRSITGHCLMVTTFFFGGQSTPDGSKGSLGHRLTGETSTEPHPLRAPLVQHRKDREVSAVVSRRTGALRTHCPRRCGFRLRCRAKGVHRCRVSGSLTHGPGGPGPSLSNSPRQ